MQYLLDALAGKELALGKTDHGSEVVEFNGNKMDLLPAVLVTKENVDDPNAVGKPGQVGDSARWRTSPRWQLRSTCALSHWSRRVPSAKRYGTTLALDNVSLKVQAGHSVALAGRNGAGKSTMVRLLTGLDRPDTGEVRFAGEPRAGYLRPRAMAVAGRLRLPEVDDHPGTHASGRISS